jgi:hypothetical protein
LKLKVNNGLWLLYAFTPRYEDLREPEDQRLKATQYVVDNPLGGHVTDRFALRDRLAEIGLNQEAFSLSSNPSGKLALTFWELDRIEALRIIAKLQSSY